MKHYVVFNPETRQIIQSGSCTEIAFDALAERYPNDRVEEIDQPSLAEGTHWTRDGRAVEESSGRVYSVERDALVADLEAIKRSALETVDSEAEGVRGRVLTPGDGQASEYWAARSEAQMFLAGVSGDSYAMLQASVDVGEAPDLYVAAMKVQDRESECREALAHIRRARLEAKRSIREATDEAHVHAARNRALSEFHQAVA